MKTPCVHVCPIQPMFFHLDHFHLSSHTDILWIHNSLFAFVCILKEVKVLELWEYYHITVTPKRHKTCDKYKTHYTKIPLWKNNLKKIHVFRCFHSVSLSVCYCMTTIVVSVSLSLVLVVKCFL